MKTSILKVGCNMVSVGFVSGACAMGADTGRCAFEQCGDRDVESPTVADAARNLNPANALSYRTLL